MDLIFFDGERETEVEHFDTFAGQEHDVLGFEVSMHDEFVRVA